MIDRGGQPEDPPVRERGADCRPPLRRHPGLGAETQARHSKVARQPGSLPTRCQSPHSLPFNPKHASWLNQIELWFSTLARKVLRRGSFTSAQDLKDKINSFTAFFNKTFAKPFQWTMRGKPLSM
jgi:hypothetical protein